MTTQPYIDLHLHLDGAITVEIARKLAAIQSISIESTDEELEKRLTVPEDCTSLNDFLKCFDLPLSLMQTAEGISEAVSLVAENIRKQGVIYAEIRFAPQLHTKQGLSQEEVIAAALEGLKKTELKANFILCCMRGSGNEAENDLTVSLAKKYLVEDGGVVAIDLAGAEALFPTKNYKELFEKARKEKIPFTIHAGEADGADSVRCAIEYGARRIGHGVRAKEDASLLRLAKEKQIFFEMCPTSNILTHAIENIREFPLFEYMEYGIPVTLNTDDMAIEGITLSEEYDRMEQVFGMSEEQRRILLDYAVDAAFTTEEVRNDLKRQLNISKF